MYVDCRWSVLDFLAPLGVEDEVPLAVLDLLAEEPLGVEGVLAGVDGLLLEDPLGVEGLLLGVEALLVEDLTRYKNNKVENDFFCWLKCTTTFSVPVVIQVLQFANPNRVVEPVF